MGQPGLPKGLFYILMLFQLIFINSGYLFAQDEPPSLERFVAEAKENNPEIKALQERVKAMESRARAEGVLDDPTLKVEMEDLQKDRPLEISPGNAMLTRYTLSQMFPFPGKLSLREKIASKEALAAVSQLRSKELEIAAMVKEAYYDYSLIDESIRITKEIMELLSDMSGVAETKYSTGQVSQQDVIKVNVELTALNNDIISLEAEKGMAAAKLKSILNRPQGTPLDEPGKLPKNRLDFSTEELIDKAIKKNPEIRMAETEAEADELSADLAKKNYYPDFMIGVAPIQRDGRFDSFDVMFQMNIPIWRGKYDNQSKEASFNAISAKSRVVSEKNRTSFEVKGAALQVEAADRMRSLYETSLLPQVELSFDSALKNYQTGRIDFLSLLDAERDLKRTRIEYLRTLAEYQKRVAALERAVGENLGPDTKQDMPKISGLFGEAK